MAMTTGKLESLDSSPARILVVDDEPDIRELLALTLQRMDIETRACADITSAKAQLRGREFQLCLTDMRLPDGDGLDLVGWMQAQGLRPSRESSKRAPRLSPPSSKISRPRSSARP